MYVFNAIATPLVMQLANIAADVRSAIKIDDKVKMAAVVSLPFTSFARACAEPLHGGGCIAPLITWLVVSSR